MEWNLAYGDKYQALLKLRDEGKATPALDRLPEIPSSLDWVWSAYAEFSSSRSWTMGQPQPIALAEVTAYSDLKEFTREEVEELLGFIRMLDNVFFEDFKVKAKRKK